MPEFALGVLLCIPAINSFLAGSHYSIIGTLLFPLAFIWAILTFSWTLKNASLDDEDDVWTIILVGGVSYFVLAAGFAATAIYFGSPEGLTGLPVMEQFRYLFGLFFSPLSWLFY